MNHYDIVRYDLQRAMSGWSCIAYYRLDGEEGSPMRSVGAIYGRFLTPTLWRARRMARRAARRAHKIQETA